MLVCAHACFRQALALLLDNEPGFETVAQARTLSEARRKLTGGIDVAVVDLDLPDGDGADLVGDVRKLNPRCSALVFTENPDPEVSARARKAGAGEVLRKTVTVGQVLETVKRLARQNGNGSHGRPPKQRPAVYGGNELAREAEGGPPMAEITDKSRPVGASEATPLRPRAALLHCPIARDGQDRPNLLRVPLVGGEALVVFSRRQTARRAVASENYPSGCRTRVCSGGELASLLFGPYKDVEWVLLDPPPGPLEEAADEAHRMSRRDFVDHLLAHSIPRNG